MEKSERKRFWALFVWAAVFAFLIPAAIEMMAEFGNLTGILLQSNAELLNFVPVVRALSFGIGVGAILLAANRFGFRHGLLVAAPGGAYILMWLALTMRYVVSPFLLSMVWLYSLTNVAAVWTKFLFDFIAFAGAVLLAARFGRRVKKPAVAFIVSAAVFFAFEVADTILFAVAKSLFSMIAIPAWARFDIDGSFGAFATSLPNDVGVLLVILCTGAAITLLKRLYVKLNTPVEG